MTITQQLALGWGTYAYAHRFIKQHKLYRLFALPVLINVALFSVLVWLGLGWANALSEALYGWFGLSYADWDNFNWLKTVIYWTLNILLNLAIFIAYLNTIRYIMLILIAPILAYVSERTEELATGRSYPFSISQLIKDTGRGMGIAVRNGITEIFLTVLLLALGFIPVIGWVTPLLLFVVQSYFFGFSMMDYYFERQKLSGAESRSFIFKHKWVAVGNGAYFNGLVYLFTIAAAALPLIIAVLAKVLFIVPVLFLSIMPIYSVVAGTLAALKLNENLQPHGQIR